MCFLFWWSASQCGRTRVISCWGHVGRAPSWSLGVWVGWIEGALLVVVGRRRPLLALGHRASELFFPQLGLVRLADESMGESGFFGKHARAFWVSLLGKMEGLGLSHRRVEEIIDDFYGGSLASLSNFLDSSERHCWINCISGKCKLHIKDSVQTSLEKGSSFHEKSHYRLHFVHF